ncbi:hypothetical protein B0T17DRAFT_492309 [Bombardia bombarda]|uniref:Rhodopsin domain-containing protein n=1 Tax=Bombardia bombarda TaxID=252184 RepID=A0AA39X0Z4_9PEZI|nr:hypothetical protein B0T17DRAFT_492309 [Bombardia bombarda]
MTLYSSAPPARPFRDDKANILVSWWITVLCAVIILLRLAGRYVRVEKLFPEDRYAALALLPLFARMACIHVVLIYGTNNVLLENDGLSFSQEEVRRRSTGSSLVLVTRILYPATLWVFKAATLSFFDRLISSTGKKRYVYTLWFMRGMLGATFFAVIVSDLGECMPMKAYWQVVPDPGAHCRQGYANLLTVAVCNTLANILLVVFPVPIIISSRIPLGRKVSLITLFSLGLVAVIISIYRVPEVVREHAYQPTRTMWASVELLVATIVANALALGSFIRDTGIKKIKFKYDPHSHHSNSGGGGTKHTVQLTSSRKDPWDGMEDDGSEGGGAGPKEAMGVSSTINARDSKPSSIMIHARESQDSLIPRGGEHHARRGSRSNNVIMTTTIDVTVSDAAGAGDMDRAEEQQYRRPLAPLPVKSASVRGTGRGSTKVLQNVASLPEGSAGQKR